VILLIVLVVIMVSGAGVAYAVTRSGDSAVQCPAGYGYVYGPNIRGHCAP
jgi:hypothetical protein